MIHGEDLIIAIGGNPLAASKSCNVNKAQSFIEVASPTSSAWESFIPTKRGWKISSDCLLATMDAYKTLDAAWKAGTALDIRFHDTEYNENEIGTAYIESLDLTASKGNLAKMSVSLRGSGALSAGTRAITVSKQPLLGGVGHYYVEDILRAAFIVASATNGKAFAGTFTLSKETLARITTGGNTVLLSQNSTLQSKALLGSTIDRRDYSIKVTENTDIWLDAGTWYFVDTNENYLYNTFFRSIDEKED